MAGRKADLGQTQASWNKMAAAYEKAYPQEAAELGRCLRQDLPDLDSDAEFWSFSGSQATRSTSGVCLNRLAARLPNLIGGSADLAPSTKTVLEGKNWFSAADYSGANIHFGVREFAMAAAANGMALHGGLRPFCATFFVFFDYMKAAVRMSAIMKLPVTYVFTHDSIGVGEDGPTHQPIEHLAALRAVPGVTVFRPADGKETAAGYCLAMKRQGPTCLILTRQNLPTQDATGPAAMCGGYILRDAPEPALILIASGSEVDLALKSADRLAESQIAVRVVSMPSQEIFEEQTDAYKESVLPRHIRARLAIEAGSAMPWYRYVGLDGDVVGIDHFGASAPAGILFEQYGFSVDQVVSRAIALLQ
jgi:transketolase